MKSDASGADSFTPVSLRATTESDYCRAAIRKRHNEFWWYYHGLVPVRGICKPFQDADGRWWHHVKPGFAWPVNFFTALERDPRSPPKRLLMGWQYPTDAGASNSQVWLNVIHDLSGYGLASVASNKRRAVRKGFRNLRIQVERPSDPALAAEACDVWNSHVERTGWNATMKPTGFARSWAELENWPGTTVLTARDPARSEVLCAWLISRIIDDTVYVDTIASHTDRLEHRPNDGIIFACLSSAAQAGVRHAHYSLKSALSSLEAFKESLGFTAHPFPARLTLRRPIGTILRSLRPGIHRRLHGDPVWSEPESRRRPLTPAAEEPPRAVEQPASRTAADDRGLSEPVAAEVARLERSWYVPPRRPRPAGWLVCSLDFVLAILQGSLNEPQNVRRTWPWLATGAVVRAAVAVGQVCIMILAWLPVVSWFVEIAARTFTRNAFGFFLRSCYWKARLRSLGADTIIDQGVEIWGPANVSIGSNCHIDTNVRLAAGERRHGQRGSIVIGDHAHLGPGVHVAGRGGIYIGNFVGISSNAHLYSATNAIENPVDPGELVSMSHMAPRDQQHIVEGPIVVDDYAFVGMMARIMPGVRIGRGAVVHADVELTRDVPPFANYGGVPRGRQIGWRRPRRPSPCLTSVESGRPDRVRAENEPEVTTPPSADPAAAMDRSHAGPARPRRVDE